MLTGLDSNQKAVHFKELYEMHYASFCLYAKHFINSAEICEDIVSDVFAGLWNRMNALDPGDTLTVAYIKVCVKNACINYIKHRLHEKDFVQFIEHKAPVYELDGRDEVYSLDQLYHELFKTLEQLPQNYREVFLKTYMENKTMDEIAAELNVSSKSVLRYKQKVLELLKEKFKDYLPLLLVLISCSSLK
ncbi:MAG: sigma-70 family RNA polymerase sigma factor [Candidatus Cryptobacteroides sp.]